MLCFFDIRSFTGSTVQPQEIAMTPKTSLFQIIMVLLK